MEADFSIPSPDGYEWKVKDGKLSVEWMLLPPAQDEVLQLVSCGCKKTSCERQSCLCFAHGIPCTDLCGCGELCQNKADSESTVDSDDSESDSESDSEE